ncbi:o-succinylbenzoate--CoA ligase [Bacillaceae bacterium S4-13-56]
MTTMPHWLNKRAHLSPNKVAIDTPNGDSLTFNQWKELSQTYARKFSSISIKEGDKVGILYKNSLDVPILLYALSYIGAVGVLLNVRLTIREFVYQLEDAHVNHLIHMDDMKPTIDEIKGHLPYLKTWTKEDMHQLEDKPYPLKESLNLSSTFTLMYTSGTTGFPKGVPLSYGNHWWSAIGSALNLGIHEEDCWLAVLPLFHVGGLSVIHKSVIYGMSIRLYEGYDTKMVANELRKGEITIMSVVTMMVQQLIEEENPETFSSNLRCMLLGGGPAPQHLLEQGKSLGVPIFQSYGMTETASQMVTLSPEDSLRKIGSAGKPLFPGELKIVKNNRSAHPNEVGEIHVRGPMVMNSYLGREHERSEDGWLSTGDLGYIDDEGYLYVKDRQKDVIISGGENIYPAEIEHVLIQHPAVKEVAVVGHSDKKWGQVPVAFVVVKNAFSQEELYEFCKKELASYKVPKRYYSISTLPRTASNKIQRHKLIELLEKEGTL